MFRRLLIGGPPLRQEMISAARRAPRLLGESTDLVRRFVLQKQNADGGFQDRAGRSDLYYTLFGLQALLALKTPFSPESVRSHLAAFGEGDSLDFVHLCCLARCRALLHDMQAASPGNAAICESLARRIEAHRAQDGGYHAAAPGQAQGSAYAAFLALGAYQDLKIRLPNAGKLADSLRRLAIPGGGWANEKPATTSSTNPTVAAMAVLASLRRRAAYREAGNWLLAQAHPLGGFRAAPLAPVPDLLSTATALHAIASLGLPLEPIRERCLDFIDTLWSNEGGFHGHWQDEVLDVEYTFYGLLALGVLAR